MRLRDLRITLRTDRGVFASAGLDPGTAVLLQEAPHPPASGSVLDLGCGHGVIAVALAQWSPGARIIAVDVNRRALELARINSLANGAGNVEVAAPEDVDPELRFTAIYSNPPVRIGQEALTTLLARWIGRLEADGRAFLVVQRHLGADSLAVRLEAAGLQVRRLASKRGYRVLQVRGGGRTAHHP